MTLPKWYSSEKYPIIEVDIHDGYVHFLCAKRPKGVRYSLGCDPR